MVVTRAELGTALVAIGIGVSAFLDKIDGQFGVQVAAVLAGTAGAATAVGLFLLGQSVGLPEVPATPPSK